LELPKEFLDALEGLNTGINALNESLAAEKTAREAAVAEAARVAEEAAKPKAATAAEIAGALREAKLSTKAEARVLSAVEAGADLTEAVKAEKDIAAEYLAEAAANAGGGHIEEAGTLTEAQQLDKAFADVFSS